MQTFLPLPDFAESARCLDRQRLGKQRVECLQILRTLTGVPNAHGWARHPAVMMWRGYESCLLHYGEMICNEWTGRGYVDNCLSKMLSTNVPAWLGGRSPSPPWLGDPAFHASHRSNLLRKNPTHYGQFGWTEPSDLEYVWPVRARGEKDG